jgi:3-oxoacyl-[acyl-carrier-protein] synthase III
MKILNVSYSLPGKRVTNDSLVSEIIRRSRKHFSLADVGELEKRLRRFFRLSGSKIRYHRDAGEKACDIAIKAGQKALDATGIDPTEIDLLIYAGVGRGWIEPATANLFQSELKLTGATCFDVLDACASWIRSLSIAQSFLNQKVYKKIMILNSECNVREYANVELRSLDELEQSFSAFTIGEAATATIVSAEGSPEGARFSFRSWGEKHGLCKIALPNADDFTPAGEEKKKPMSFTTLPGELLTFTMKKLVAHVKDTPSIGNLLHDKVFIHSVSVPSTTKVARLLGFGLKQVFECHARFGNTVSASLPLAMAVAEEEGELERGMRALLLMGSAGVTTGIGSIEY